MIRALFVSRLEGGCGGDRGRRRRGPADLLCRRALLRRHAPPPLLLLFLLLLLILLECGKSPRSANDVQADDAALGAELAESLAPDVRRVRAIFGTTSGEEEDNEEARARTREAPSCSSPRSSLIV